MTSLFILVVEYLSCKQVALVRIQQGAHTLNNDG